MSFKTIFKRLRAERLAFASFIFLVMLVSVALLAPHIQPYDPFRQDLTKVMQLPSAEHWLGTDGLGCDVLSKMLMGSQTAIKSALFAIMIPLLVGVPLGVLSGYFGGVMDDVFMRIVDAIIAIPALILALGITSALGVNLWNAMMAIGIVFTPKFARLARGQTLQVRLEPYVEAAKISGAGFVWIMFRHILPNISPPIVVQASFNLSMAILTETTLSFLGMGAQPPDVSWGNLIQQGYSLIYINPWMIVYPGIAIMLTILAGNFLGDGLRVALDPKQQRIF